MTAAASPPPLLYGTAWKEDRTQALVEQALRAGFRGVDTANQRKHYCEQAVGDALAAAYADGVVARGDLFVQTKFTYRRGQDHRLPYDPDADLATQVAQSVASSLVHLRTDYVDALLLHGPSHGAGWTDDDVDVWAAMERERDAGRARALGVSNVTAEQLDLMGATPAYVQNRCYARTGWDRAVRAWCAARSVVYQGFSLLTANPEALRSDVVVRIAAARGATPAQIVFRFAQGVGMLPLTGTSDARHMREDLAAAAIALSDDDLRAIEAIAG